VFTISRRIFAAVAPTATQRCRQGSSSGLRRSFSPPVGDVYTSQLNRAYQTAVLAGFKDIVKSADVTEGGVVVSPKENDYRTTAFRKLLTVAPKSGTDTVIITHKPNIVDALDKDWFDVKEGEASILKSNGAARSSSSGSRLKCC
jgi:hypothetical protein